MVAAIYQGEESYYAVLRRKAGHGAVALSDHHHLRLSRGLEA